MMAECQIYTKTKMRLLQLRSLVSYTSMFEFFHSANPVEEHFVPGMIDVVSTCSHKRQIICFYFASQLDSDFAISQSSTDISDKRFYWGKLLDLKTKVNISLLRT